MKEQLARVQQVLVILFWSGMSFAILSLLFILYILGPDLGQVESSIVFERYSIIITLIGIPLALKLFHNQYKKLQESAEIDKSKKYFQISIIRTMILEAVVLINLAGLYAYEGKNFIYMCIITIFAFIFAFPNKAYINELEEKEEINNSNIE